MEPMEASRTPQTQHARQGQQEQPGQQAQRTGREERQKPADPPEFSYSAGTHSKVMESLSLRRMAARLPSALGQTARMAWQTDPRSLVWLVAGQITAGICTAATLAAVSDAMGPLLTGGDAGSRIEAAAAPLVTAALTAATGTVAQIVSGSAARRLTPRLATLADLAMVDAHMDVEVGAYDQPGFTDRSEAAGIGAARSTMLVKDAMAFTNGLVNLVAVAGVLTVVHPALLPLLLLSVVPRGLGALIAARLDYSLHNETNASRNIRGMMRWYLTTHKLADELRCNSMRPYAHHWYATVCERIDAKLIGSAPRFLRVSLVAAALGGLFQAGTWAALAGLVLGGYMALAAAGTAIVAMRTSATALSSLVVYGAYMFQHALYLEDYRGFLELAASMSGRRGQAVAGPPAKLVLEEAAYTYPGKDAPALGPVSLSLSRGEIIAVVGENGAGKSTLIRLLTGLTLPGEGEVYWDGVPTRDADQESLWAHVGLVAQSFAYWPFTARENITLGQPDEERGEAAVWEALDAVGMRKAVEDFPNGLDTLLARSLWGGHEPSGGQWQRLACGRAFHRRPTLLIMDEPTSAMDARGEHRIFSGLQAMKDERITLIVTHRMENCRLADRILVLEAGRITEQGSFAELVALDGTFAELYRLSQER
ncbi:ATP-binding cassette domain-containing protein [Streptomyces sp. NPDC086023]|uniref:ATP-binding cassette domain-containing protein n=1 Tax=Streptomyces sp. NPDC086023 TaxID=3365746 RepID=UPI0037CE420F